jgi:hypothetical protein
MYPTHDLLVPISPIRQLIWWRISMQSSLSRLFLRRFLPISAAQLGRCQFAEFLCFGLDLREKIGVFEGLEWVESVLGLVSWEEEQV